MPSADTSKYATSNKSVTRTNFKKLQKGEPMHKNIVDKMKDTLRNEGVDTLPGQRLIARWP